MKKVLIGLGIGCGVLIIVGVVVMFIGGMWLKKKVGGSFTQIAEAGKKMEAQKLELESLNTEFPFTAPAEGVMLRLDETRLQDYLKVRSTALPLFKTYEAKAKGLEAEIKKSPGGAVTAAMQGTAMITDMLTELRATFITALRTQKMSPAEYHHHTAAIYGTAVGQSVNAMADSMADAGAQMQKSINDMQAQVSDPNLSAEQKTEIQKQIDAMQEQMQSLGKSADQQVSSADPELLKANADLIEKYKAQIDETGNVAYDLLIGTEDYSKAMKGVFPDGNK